MLWVVEGAAVDDVGSRSPRLTSPDHQLRHVVDDGRTSRSHVPVTVSLLAAEPDSGLGFDVTGDQTGAVFVREVFDHGPATQTGKIRPGDIMLPMKKLLFWKKMLCSGNLILCRLAKCCDASMFALAAKYHIEPHDAVRSSVARIKDSFWFYFSELV